MEELALAGWSRRLIIAGRNRLRVFTASLVIRGLSRPVVMLLFRRPCLRQLLQAIENVRLTINIIIIIITITTVIIIQMGLMHQMLN